MGILDDFYANLAPTSTPYHQRQRMGTGDDPVFGPNSIQGDAVDLDWGIVETMADPQRRGEFGRDLQERIARGTKTNAWSSWDAGTEGGFQRMFDTDGGLDDKWNAFWGGYKEATDENRATAQREYEKNTGPAQGVSGLWGGAAELGTTLLAEAPLYAAGPNYGAGTLGAKIGAKLPASLGKAAPTLVRRGSEALARGIKNAPVDLVTGLGVEAMKGHDPTLSGAAFEIGASVGMRELIHGVPQFLKSRQLTKILNEVKTKGGHDFKISDFNSQINARSLEVRRALVETGKLTDDMLKEADLNVDEFVKNVAINQAVKTGANPVQVVADLNYASLADGLEAAVKTGDLDKAVADAAEGIVGKGNLEDVRGFTRTNADTGKTTIGLSKDMRPGTLSHENAHWAFNILPDSTKADIAKKLKIKDGVWTQEAKEAWAVGFERYMMDGKAPAGLGKEFAEVGEQIKKFYNEGGTGRGSFWNKEVPEPLRAHFDERFKTPSETDVKGAVRAVRGADDVEVPKEAEVPPAAAEAPAQKAQPESKPGWAGHKRAVFKEGYELKWNSKKGWTIKDNKGGEYVLPEKDLRKVDIWKEIDQAKVALGESAAKVETPTVPKAEPEAPTAPSVETPAVKAEAEAPKVEEPEVRDVDDPDVALDARAPEVDLDAKTPKGETPEQELARLRARAAELEAEIKGGEKTKAPDTETKTPKVDHRAAKATHEARVKELEDAGYGDAGYEKLIEDAARVAEKNGGKITVGNLRAAAYSRKVTLSTNKAKEALKRMVDHGLVEDAGSGASKRWVGSKEAIGKRQATTYELEKARKGVKSSDEALAKEATAEMKAEQAEKAAEEKAFREERKAKREEELVAKGEDRIPEVSHIDELKQYHGTKEGREAKITGRTEWLESVQRTMRRELGDEGIEIAENLVGVERFRDQNLAKGVDMLDDMQTWDKNRLQNWLDVMLDKKAKLTPEDLKMRSEWRRELQKLGDAAEEYRIGVVNKELGEPTPFRKMKGWKLPKVPPDLSARLKRLDTSEMMAETHGSFTHHRTPGGEDPTVDNVVNVMRSYLEDGWGLVAQAKVLGEMKGKNGTWNGKSSLKDVVRNWRAKLEKAGTNEQGLRYFDNNIDTILGKTRHGFSDQFWRDAMAVESATKLVTSIFNNVTQQGAIMAFTNPALAIKKAAWAGKQLAGRAALRNAEKGGVLKPYRDTILKSLEGGREEFERVMRTGATAGTIARQIAGTGDSTAQRFSRLALKMVGFTGSEKWLRVTAAAAGVEHAEGLFKRLVDLNSGAKAKFWEGTGRAKGIERELARMGVDVKGALKRGQLDETDVLNAGWWMSEKTQHASGRMHVPPLWSGGAGRSAGLQFLGFSHKQMTMIWDDVIKYSLREAAQGNTAALMRLGVFPTATAALGFTTKYAKDILTGKDRSKDSEFKRVKDALLMATALDMFGRITDRMDRGDYWGALPIGPAPRDIMNLFAAGFDAKTAISSHFEEKALRAEGNNRDANKAQVNKEGAIEDIQDKAISFLPASRIPLNWAGVDTNKIGSIEKVRYRKKKDGDDEEEAEPRRSRGYRRPKR